MSYRIELVSSAERQFKKLRPQVRNRILQKIILLENQPKPSGSKKLHDTPYYRIRIGDYRVIYSVDDADKLVRILDAGHRREVYRSH